MLFPRQFVISTKTVKDYRSSQPTKNVHTKTNWIIIIPEGITDSFEILIRVLQDILAPFLFIILLLFLFLFGYPSDTHRSTMLNYILLQIWQYLR